jgi:two-component system response regulator DesR
LIRIIIAGKVPLISTGLIALLSPEPDLQIVAQVERGDQIIPAASLWRPDVAIIDADLLGVDDLTMAVSLHDVLPECHTLVLANTGSPGLISRGWARTCRRTCWSGPSAR